MGRLCIQLLLEGNIWITHYTIPKSTQYGNTSTDWTLVNLSFTVENYGIKLFHDQIDTDRAVMSFSKIRITHSV